MKSTGAKGMEKLSEHSIILILVGVIVLQTIALLLTAKLSWKCSNIIVRGDFKVFATLLDNPNQLWLEVFNKKRGVGIALNENLFYIISMVVDETSNASLSVNVPKLAKMPGRDDGHALEVQIKPLNPFDDRTEELIPNDTMHPPERYCPKCGYDLFN